MRYFDAGPVGRRRRRFLSRQPLATQRFQKKIKILFFCGALLGVSLILMVKLNLLSWLTPLSVFSQIINPSGLRQSDGRTNVLILGLDTRTQAASGSAVLADTIIVGSLSRIGGDPVLISVPRDLWVPLDDYYSGKINSAYSLKGVDALRKIVEKVLGIPVHYHLVIGFEGFHQVVDTLGGIEVDVERSFDDYRYPIEGREQWQCPEKTPDLEEGATAGGEATTSQLQEEEVFHPCRYEHVHFDAGRQVMSGEIALKYARSRYALGPEGSDFARALRQQKVIMAVRDKALSWETLTNPGKVKELYEAYQRYVETDIGLPEAEGFLDFGRQLGKVTMATYVLGNGLDESGRTLLISPGENSLYGGQYALIPRAGNFSAVRAWVQKMLFGGD